MEVLHRRCAGLDVHSRRVNACVRLAAGRTVTTEHREFATTTAGLLALAAWLTEAGCTHVAMEATGVYWKPVWHILEDEASLTLVLANAQHIRNVPGRKSDRNDAAWIADLLAHGLIRGSFVPPAPIQELRDLTRTRKQLVGEIARHTQRLQKTLEDANVKLTRVVTDILGVSGRAILTAIIAGETDPERLADCTTGRLKASRADIVTAVHGRVTSHHRFYMDASPMARFDSVYWEQVAVLYSACSCRISSCWPRWNQPTRASFCWKGLPPEKRFRLGGSRSDLFAITPFRTCAPFIRRARQCIHWPDDFVRP